MKKLFTLVLTLTIFFSSSTSDPDNSSEDRDLIVCQYAGQIWSTHYEFNISDLIERCDIIIVGYYLFDYDELVNTHVYEADKNVMRCLVAAKKTIYLYLAFSSTDAWDVILNPTDQVKCENKMKPLIDFMSEFYISGIILDGQDLYTGKKGLDCQINTFAGNIKKIVANLKVGMVVSGPSYTNFSRNDLFNFEITNENLDHYFIDLSPSNDCDANTKKSGLTPIHSNNANLTSMEQISCAVYQSSMEKCKIYARLMLGVIMPPSKDTNRVLTSYTEYCANTDISCYWCADKSDTLYKQGQFAKSLPYHGLMLTFLETDDYNGCFGCGQFPAANLILDGWENKPYKKCVNMDK